MMDVNLLEESVEEAVKTAMEKGLDSEEGTAAINNAAKVAGILKDIHANNREEERIDNDLRKIKLDEKRCDFDHSPVEKGIEIGLDVLKIALPTMLTLWGAFKLADKSVEINNLENVIPDRDVKNMSMKLFRF